MGLRHKKHHSLTPLATNIETRRLEALSGGGIGIDAPTAIRAARMMMVVRAELDRQVVAFHLIHGLDLPTVAAKMGLTTHQAEDRFESVCALLRKAESYSRAENSLRAWREPPPRPDDSHDSQAQPTRAPGCLSSTTPQRPF